MVVVVVAVRPVLLGGLFTVAGEPSELPGDAACDEDEERGGRG